MQTYIPVSQAAEQYGIDPVALNRAAVYGTIDAIEINGNGEIAVAKEDVQYLLEKDQELMGKRIRLNEAAEKYDMPEATLSRWASAGYIEIIERAPKLLILDEASVNLVVSIYKKALAHTKSPLSAGWALRRSMQYLLA